MKYYELYLNVSLTVWQRRVCRATGEMRQRNADTNHYQSKFDACTTAHITGCYGECGVALYLNVAWPMSDKLDRDTGDLILPDGRPAQVRARSPRTDGKGPLTYDADERMIYVFTQIELPRVIFLGWIPGALIPEVGEWCEGEAFDMDCWRIALVDLGDISELKS